VSSSQIHPHKVTKPIQLLGAWLLGLTVINGSFLGAAVAIANGQWERGALVIAAIANVPIFLIALFVLQTKFRAELQEDSFYFQYISRKTDAVVTLDKLEISEIIEEFPKRTLSSQEISTDGSSESEGILDWSRWKIAMNDHRPDFLEIREALQSEGIPVSVIFGAVNRTPFPGNWTVSINSNIGFVYVLALLRVLIRFEFNGFNRWEPRPDAEETEDVYIGGYGVKSYVRITPELKDLLAKPFDEITFKYHCVKNVKK
jgi:hypothetical protein